jgi:hypothetical protein
MTKVLQMFAGKTEVDLSKEFDLEGLFSANVTAMYHKYAYFAFEAVPADKDDLPYSHANCPASWVKLEFLELADEYIREPEAGEKAEKGEKAALAERAKWEYRHSEMHLTHQFIQHNADVRMLLANPLLPSKLCEHIEALLDTSENNVHLLDEVIESAAIQMPDKYPTFETLTRGSFGWIHAEYVRRRKPLEGLADEISAFVRSYFSTDRLLE